ncbi:MAG: formylglycine-generating enzyme family protein [Planctomycetota bacterium]|jgi:formylglycine-generating enzyme required for sulfatase activity
MRPRILAATLLLAAGCGGDEPADITLEAKEIAVAKESAAEQRAADEKAAFAAAIDAALELVHQGDLDAAKRAADEAGLLPAANTDQVKALRQSIEAEALRRERNADLERLRRVLRRQVTAEDPIERAKAFEQQAADIFEIVGKYPDLEDSEEVTAAAAFAEAEARKHRTYVEALAAARTAIDEKRFGDAIDAAEKAWSSLPYEEARSLRQKAVRKAAPDGMVLVPGGPFPMGRKKVMTVVRSFYIDRTEVTCRQYLAFVRATGHSVPEGWGGGQPPKGKEDHPVVRVTGDDAATYAKWAGKRLPTEMEWEKAARGPEGRVFPWGDEWDERTGNFGNKGTAAVGESPGDFSYYGLHDMAGNVAEFTAPVIPFPEPALPEAKENRPKWAVKGGHWASGAIPEDNSLFLRFPFRPKDKDTGTGFRCAADAR